MKTSPDNIKEKVALYWRDTIMSHLETIARMRYDRGQIENGASHLPEIKFNRPITNNIDDWGSDPSGYLNMLSGWIAIDFERLLRKGKDNRYHTDFYSSMLETRNRLLKSHNNNRQKIPGIIKKLEGINTPIKLDSLPESVEYKHAASEAKNALSAAEPAVKKLITELKHQHEYLKTLIDFLEFTVPEMYGLSKIIDKDPQKHPYWKTLIFNCYQELHRQQYGSTDKEKHRFIANLLKAVYPKTLRDFKDGKMEPGELAKKMLLATPNKIANSAAPFFKLAGELITGKSIYPDITKPAQIRDKAEHAARFLSLDNEYKAMTGKPTRGYLDSLKGLYLYENDPGEIAYQNTRRLAAKYLEKNGKESVSGEPTKRSNALYYYKQALRYDDEAAADKYKEEYFAEGGTKEGIQKSIAKAHPMWMLPLNQRAKFRQSLSAQELETLTKGIEWYRQVYAP